MNGTKPFIPVQDAKLTLNNNYSINVSLFAVRLVNVVLVIWQSLNYLYLCCFIFRLYTNRGRPLWSSDIPSKMGFGVRCWNVILGQNFNCNIWSIRSFEVPGEEACSNTIPRLVALSSPPKSSFFLPVIALLNNCRHMDPDFQQ